MKIFALLLAATFLPAYAQDVPEYPQMPKSLVQYFVFSTEQTNAICLLNQELMYFIFDKLDEVDQLDTFVSDELEKTAPDPALIGQRVVEIEMAGRSISEKLESTIVAVQAVLSQEQVQKLRVLQDAARFSGTIELATDWGILRSSPDSVGGSLPLLVSQDRVAARIAKLNPDRKAQLTKLLARKSATR